MKIGRVANVLVVIAGVSGVGKTTIGRLLSTRLAVPFFDADDFHPSSNLQKMAGGMPLDDADRQPWLLTLSRKLQEWQREGGAVVACSALREDYRATLESRCDEPLRWIFLLGSEALLTQRLAEREGHFFDPSLLRSQLDTFEIPDYGVHTGVDDSPQEIVDAIIERLDSP